MAERVGAEHCGAERAATPVARAERIVAEELQRLGWQEADLARLAKGDAGKVAAAVRRTDGDGAAGEMDCRAFAHGRAAICEPAALPAAQGNRTISRPDGCETNFFLRPSLAPEGRRKLAGGTCPP